MKTNVLITAVQVLKSGVNDKTKKAWTLFKYEINPITIEGASYTSFSSFTAHPEGPYEADLEVNVNGQWKNLREVSPMSPAGKKLADLERRVALLEKFISKGAGESSLPTVKVEDDLDVEF